MKWYRIIATTTILVASFAALHASAQDLAQAQNQAQNQAQTPNQALERGQAKEQTQAKEQIQVTDLVPAQAILPARERVEAPVHVDRKPGLRLPVDGEMVVLDAANMWTISDVPEAKLTEISRISTNTKFPSISPNGDKVVLFSPEKGETPKRLIQWSRHEKTDLELMRGQDVSTYVTWDDADNISMRQADKPFFHDGQMLKLKLGNKKATLRAKKRLSESKYFTYDADDIIILVRKDTETLQAISDTSADRYYSPMLSPDEKFVVFNGLTTGVHVFDIEQNAVVYIGEKGTDPSFSPDGRYLIYAVTTDDGDDFTSGNLVLIDLKTHSRRTISNPSKEIRLRGSISYDAQFVAYETTKGVFRAKIVKK